MPRHSPAEIYTMLVLRDVPYHQEETYIEKQIRGDISRDLGVLIDQGMSEREAVKTLPPHTAIAKKYRRIFRGSGLSVDGLMLFNRFFMNVSGIALMMVTLLVMFRIYPQPEYLVYLFCAFSAVVAGIIAYRRLHSILLNLITVFVPIFLLLYYPIKETYELSLQDKSSFFDLFFSYANHEVFFVVILIAILFPLTLMWLYSKRFLSKTAGLFVRIFSLILLVVSFLFFSLYTLKLKHDYDTSALTIISALNLEYENYINQNSIDNFAQYALKMDALVSKYGSIYRSAPDVITGSLSSLIDIFQLYDTDYAELVKYYHPAFDPEKQNPFNTAGLDDAVTHARKRVSIILAAGTESPNFKTLIGIMERCEVQKLELLESLGVYFTDWAYSK